MNNKSLFFLAFACLFASVFSQVSFDIPSPIYVARTFNVGIKFTVFQIADANSIVTVTPAAVAGVTITPSSLSFNTTTEVDTYKYLTITASARDVFETVALTYASTSSFAYTPTSFSFTAVARSVIYSTSSSTAYVGIPSASISVAVPSFATPDTGSVTVTFFSDPPVATFTPPSVTINARTSSSSAQQANFYYTISNYLGSATLYATLSNSVNFAVSNATIGSSIRPAPLIPAFGPTIATRTSNNVVAQLAYAPVTSVSYRPTAANTTFTPSVLTFTPSVTSISFSFVSSYPGSYPITFTTEGADAAIYNNFTASRTAVASRAPAYLSTPTTNSLLMTQASANFIFTLSTPAVNGLTVTPTVVESGSNTYVVVTPSTLTFAAGETTKTFTLSSAFAVSANSISFALSGPDAPFFTAPSVSTNFPYVWKRVSLSTDAGSSDGYCGDAKTFTLRTDFPTVSGFAVAISPSSGNTDPVVISPASINFVAGDTQHTFTVTGSGSPSISFSVTGQDVSNLDNQLSSTTVNFNDKLVTISAPSPSTAYPGTTVQYAVTVDQLPATTLTVTPSASGVTFSPSSVTFTPTTGKTIYVSAVAPSAATFVGSWSLSGTDSECFFLNNPAFGLVVSSISTSSNYNGNPQYRKAYPITIRVPNLSADLTATVSAADTQGTPYAASFSQSILTFSRAVSTVTFTVTFNDYSTNNIRLSFALTGAPASYVTIAPITLSVDTIEVKVPVFGSGANDESFYFNTVSPTFSVPLVVPTTNGLTVRIHANQMTITPSALTYAAGASVATFSFSNRVAGVTTDTITYTLEGPDADLYSLSASSTNVKFTSIPIYNNLDDTDLVLTVGKPFTFVLSTPVAPANVLTLLPQGPFTFSPASITLGPTSTSISVTATPTSAMNDNLDFVLSGSDAPFYAIPSSLSTNIELASIAVTAPSVTSISTGLSSQPYTLTANVVPANGITVTPYSPLVTFTPASITLDAQHPSRTFTFTVNPNTITAAGTTTVVVSYILSGPDAVNYQQMGDSSFSVGTYNSKYSINFPASDSGIALTYGQSTTFSVTATGAATSVTVTPTAQNGNFVFSPPSATLTPGSLTAIFSVMASGYYVYDESFIELVLGGTDAPLFNQPANAAVTASKATVTHGAINAVTVGTSTLGSFTLNYQPLQDLTITLSTAQAGVTITPNQFAITASSTTTFTYTVTSSIAQTVTIVFASSGNSAIDFAPIANLAVAFSTGTITTNTGASSVWQAPGHTRTIRLSLNTPVVAGLIVTPVASKLTFSPATINFAAGSTYAEVNATATGTAAVGTFTMSYVLGGVDAPRYGAGSAVAYSVNQLKIVSTAVDALYADQSFTASLQTSASTVPSFDFAPITIEPVAPGFTFTPASAVFSPQQVSVTFIATASNILPATTLVYKVSNSAALQASSLTFGLNPPAVVTPSFALVGTTAGTTVAIGGTVQALFSLLGSGNNGRSSLLTAIPETTVTFSSNIDGEFTPSTVTLVNGVTTAPVSFKPTQLYATTVYIYYSVSGSGSSFFTTEGSLTFAAVGKRAVTVSAPYQLTTLTGSMTTFGQETDKFYISGVATSDFQATLTPISDYFDFNPTSINFANASSTAFSVIPKKLGRNLAIQFSISGPDAGLFTVPASVGTFSVIPLVNVSYIPALVPNKKSDPIYVVLNPAPLETVIVRPSCGSGTCIFDPPSMTFSPAVSVGSFKVTTRASNMFNPSIDNIVVPGGATAVSTDFNGGSLSFTAADSVGTYILPINTYGTTTSLTVAPNTFSISHPRYQHRVTSHVTISVSELPRSDVAVTLYGTNVEFEPAYVVFTAGGETKQKIKVTPKHSSSYELDHAPIKIEYGCSGTDRANYICPTESQHYVAIQRGYIAAAVLLSILAVVLLALAIFFFAIRPRRASTYSSGSKGKNVEIKE